MSTIRRLVTVLALLLIPTIASAQNNTAYRLGVGAQMACLASVPTHVSTRGTFWCKSTDSNKLHYTDPSGSDIAVGVVTGGLTGTLTLARIPFASGATSLIDDASLSYNTGTTPPELVQAGGWHSHNGGITIRPSADNTFGAALMLDSSAHTGGDNWIISAAGDLTSYAKWLTFWDDTGNIFRGGFTDGGHFIVANSGGTMTDNTLARLTVGGNIATNGSSTGYYFGDGSFQTTAATGNTTSATLTSGTIPVATGAGAIANSNFTAAGNTFDLAATAAATLLPNATSIALSAALTDSSTLTGSSLSAGSGGTGSVFGATFAPNTSSTAVNFGTTSNTASVAVGRSGITTTITGALTQLTGVVSLTGNAASTITTSSGNMSIDSAAALNLGTSTATSVVLGKSAINVLLPGGVIRASTAATNTAGVNFSIGLNNGGGAGGGIAAGGGGANTYTSGQGGAATTTASETATAGGGSVLSGGQGGTGAASVNGPANGGNASVLGGTAGTVTSGFSGANGGAGILRGGAGSGTGTNGTVLIGDANTSAITLGATAGSLTIAAIMQTVLPFKVGSDIASASTIAPTTQIVKVTGTTTISTMTPPTNCAQTGAGCCVKLIPTGLWSTNTAGNFALASTAVVSRTLEECYVNADAKWYPSY